MRACTHTVEEGMKSRVMVVLGAALLAASMACSSGGGGGDGGAGGDGGGGGGGPKQCAPSGNTMCTQADLDAYGQCAVQNCDAQYQKCMGAGYKSGSFGGLCGTYISCTQKCGCNDNACYQACGQPDMACTSCLTNDLNACVQSKCTLPKCFGVNKTCADLQACCAKLTDMTKKATCDATYNAVKSSGDIACNAAIQNYKTECP